MMLLERLTCKVHLLACWRLPSDFSCKGCVVCCICLAEGCHRGASDCSHPHCYQAPVAGVLQSQTCSPWTA